MVPSFLRRLLAALTVEEFAMVFCRAAASSP